MSRSWAAPLALACLVGEYNSIYNWNWSLYSCNLVLVSKVSSLSCVSIPSLIWCRAEVGDNELILGLGLFLMLA